MLIFGNGSGPPVALCPNSGRQIFGSIEDYRITVTATNCNGVVGTAIETVYGVDYAETCCEGDSGDPEGGLNNNSLEITLSPNPANEYVTVIIPEGEEPAHIKITNQMGIVVLELNSSESEQYIDTSRLPLGIYIVSVEKGSGIGTAQLSIE